MWGRQVEGRRRRCVQLERRTCARRGAEPAPCSSRPRRHRAARERALARGRVHGADRHGGWPVRELAAELYKTVRRPAVWVCVLGLLAIAVTIGYAVPWLPETFTKTTQGLPQGTTLADFKITLYPQNFVRNTVGNPLGGVFALILGVLMQGSEYGWGTVKVLYTQRAGRVAMLVGKLAALATLIVVIGLALFVADAASALAAGLLDGQSIQFPAASEIVKGMAALSLIYGFW